MHIFVTCLLAFCVKPNREQQKKVRVRFLRMLWNRYDGTFITLFVVVVINAFQFFFSEKGDTKLLLYTFFPMLLSSFQLQFQSEIGTKWCKNGISLHFSRHKNARKFTEAKQCHGGNRKKVYVHNLRRKKMAINFYMSHLFCFTVQIRRQENRIKAI